MIAHKLESDICCISCNDKSLTDSSFAQLFRDSPQGAIMMLEDIDGLFKVHRRGASLGIMGCLKYPLVSSCVLKNTLLLYMASCALHLVPSSALCLVGS